MGGREGGEGGENPLHYARLTKIIIIFKKSGHVGEFLNR